MEHIEVVVGILGRPHGLRGEVGVDVRTDEPEARFAPGAVLRSRGPAGEGRFTVTGRRWHQSRLLVTLAEVPDRTAAEQVRGSVLYAVLSADASPADPEEFYDHQLVGLAVHDPDGAPLGEVTGVRHGSAQDLLVVSTTDGRERLVPFVAALVPQIDLARGQVVVADRPGLLAPFPDE